MLRRTGICHLILIGVIIMIQAFPLSTSAARPESIQTTGLRPSSQGAPLIDDPNLLSPSADPIPGGCIGVTDPGDPEAPCCISGFVHIDGQIVAGAEVVITSQRGNQVTMFTQVFSGPVALPHYQLNLNAPPLTVVVGETITVTARYSSHERSRAYVVRAGGQQVDVVLSRNYAKDYVHEREIWIPGSPKSLNYSGDVAVNTDLGLVYVADTGNQRIQVFTNNGQFIRQWGKIGNLPGEFSGPGDLIIDTSNNIYVVDSGNHRIQKFDAQGKFIGMWGGRGAANGQLEYPSGIAIDQANNIHTLEENGRIQRFTSTGTWLSSWQSSQTPSTTISLDLAIDEANQIYVAEYGQNRIRKFSHEGVLLTSWGTQGNANGQFDGLANIAIDVNGNVLVTEWWNARVQKFTSNGGWLAVWGSVGQGNGQFSAISGIDDDASGNIYISDATRIQKFQANSQWLLSWGDVSTASGELSLPEGIIVDSTGYIYVADSSHNKIQKYAPDGTWMKSWGSFGTGNEQFNYPQGLALDTSGNIYVADTYNHRIQKFTSEGIWLHAWGTYGQGDGQFDRPQGIVVDTNGDIYVTEEGAWQEPSGHRIQKFNQSGQFLLTWGSLGTGNGQFDDPVGIAIGTDQYVYVVDSGFFFGSANNRIQKFTKTGQWVSTWGSYATLSRTGWIALDQQNNLLLPNFSGDNVQVFTSGGTQLAKFGQYGRSKGAFDGPTGIAMDAIGRVYVAERQVGRVQIFRPMTYIKPIATITQVESTSLASTDTLKAWGMGQDSDETPAINAYRWTSSRDGIIGTSPTLNRVSSALSAGTHTLTLEVRDSEGQWSEPVATTIYVAPPVQFAWTMLLYLAGDYHDGGRLLNDFNRTIGGLSQSFRNPAVRIAVQIDGRAQGDTRRLLITPGTASTPPHVEEIPITEQAMDSPATLTSFIYWGQQTFPAEHYYLAIADHGQGVQGIAWDTTSDLADDGVQNDSAYLTPAELHAALSAPNIDQIDILHLDACSMNLLEIAYEVHNSAAVLIASQYLGWSYFAYDEYQSVMSAAATPREVALGITQRYAARASADQHPYTISALDLARAESTLAAVDSLAAEMAALLNNSQSNQVAVHTIWQATQRFESNGDYVINELDMYVDLVDWASRLQISISSPAVKNRAASLLNELTGLQPFIIAGSNRYRSDTLPPQYGGGAYINMTNAHGLSIFYPGTPNSAVYDAYINDRIFNFTSDSRWRDFLIAGVGPLGPPVPLEPPPGPLPTLGSDTYVYIPVVVR